MLISSLPLGVTNQTKSMSTMGSHLKMTVKSIRMGWTMDGSRNCLALVLQVALVCNSTTTSMLPSPPGCASTAYKASPNSSTSAQWKTMWKRWSRKSSIVASSPSVPSNDVTQLKLFKFWNTSWSFLKLSYFSHFESYWRQILNFKPKMWQHWQISNFGGHPGLWKPSFLTILSE